MSRQIAWHIRFFKRIIDLTIASFGFIALCVLFPFIAIAIKLDSRGPIFYRQKRVRWLRNSDDALDWETFNIIKFRTMSNDAEQSTGPMQAREGDRRITRVGLVLRKYKLDEFPQFWQVLTGEMSVVGPRPERPELLETIVANVPFFEERSRGIKPGITGLAQVSLSYSGDILPNGALYETLTETKNTSEECYSGVFATGIEAERNELSNKLLLDITYSLAHESFWQFVRMELFVIFATPRAMLFRQRR